MGWSSANGVASGGCEPGTQCGPWLPDGGTWDGSSAWYCLAVPKLASGASCDYSDAIKRGFCDTGLTCCNNVCAASCDSTTRSTSTTTTTPVTTTKTLITTSGIKTPTPTVTSTTLSTTLPTTSTTLPTTSTTLPTTTKPTSTTTRTTSKSTTKKETPTMTS